MQCDDYIEITVYGKPTPQGSKTTGVATRFDPVTQKRVPIMKDGKFVTFTKDQNKEKNLAWRESVAQRVAEQYGGPVINGPVFVDLTFMIPRIDGHYSQRRGHERELKDSAPLYVEKSPDLDKLTRAVMDGLKGSLYTDDKFFCLGKIEKVWVHRWERQGVVIRARTPVHRTVGDQRDAEMDERQPELLAA